MLKSNDIEGRMIVIYTNGQARTGTTSSPNDCQFSIFGQFCFQFFRSNNVKVIVRKRRQTQKYGKFLIFIFTTIIFSLFAKFSPVFWLGTLQSINSSHLVLWERISWINIKNHLFGLQTADKQNLHWSGFDILKQWIHTLYPHCRSCIWKNVFLFVNLECHRVNYLCYLYVPITKVLAIISFEIYSYTNNNNTYLHNSSRF